MATLKKPTQDELKAGVMGIVDQYKGAKFGAPVPTINLPAAYGPAYNPDYAELENQPEPTAEDIYGAPPGWDWRTADKDWNGDPLPDGAISFDKYGYPFYGAGLTGVWNKIKAMWRAPVKDTGKDWWAVKGGSANDPWNIAMQQWAQKHPEDIPEELSYLKDYTLEDVNTPGTGIGETLENVQSGEIGGLAAGAAKVVGTATQGVLGTWNEAAIATKKTFSAAAEVGALTGGHRQGIFTNYINSLTPEQLGTDKPRELPKGYFGDTEKGDISEAWNKGWHAGAFLYSAAFDPMKRSEYIKALEAGDVDPDLLAMEFENPLIEMVGEMIFDPLNIPLGRVLTSEKRIRNAYDLFVRPIDGWEDAFRALEVASSDAEKVERMADLSKLTANAVKKTAAGLDNYAKSHKFFGLTADGKRYVVSRSAGEVYSWLAKNFDPNKPDDAIEMMRALANLGSGDEAKVAEAMRALTGYRRAIRDGRKVGKAFSLTPFVSKAGREAAVILNKLMDADFLDELAVAQKGGVDGVEKFINRRMEGIVNEMFPSIDDLVKRRADALEKIDKGKNVVVSKQAQMTMDGFEAVVDGQQVIVPPKVEDWLLAVNKLNNAAQKVVFPFNKFFAYVYMGLSPGYAFRNLAQDMLVGTVDFGIKTITKTPSQIIQNGVDWLGGVTPRGVAGFGGPAAAFIQKQVQTNGAKLVDALKKMDARVAAGVFEEWSSMRVVGVAVEDAMLRMMKPGRAIPDYGELIAAGMPDEMADFITQELIRNKGNVKKAVAEARKALKLGNLDAYRTVRVTDAEAGVMTRLGVHDDVLNAVKEAKDPTDLRARKDDIVRQAREFAAKTADEVTPHLPTDETVEELADVVEHLPDQRAREVADAYHVANGRAIGAYSDVLSDLRKLAPDDPDIRAMDGVLDDTAYNAIKERLHRRAYSAKMVSNKIFVKDANLDEIWSAAPLNMPGPAPKTPAEFKDRIWREYYFEVATATWNKYRDDLAAAVENIARKIGKQDSDAMLKARREMAEARKWDDVLREDEVRISLLRAADKKDNKAAVMIIANQYGIPSITDGGAKMDQRILDTINKYSEQKFDSLDDITDPDVVRKAFNKRIADKATEAMDKLVDPVMPRITKPKKPYVRGTTPTYARAIDENLEGFEQLLDRIVGDFETGFGNSVPIESNPALEKALKKWEFDAETRISEARLVAANVGNAARDFTVLSYPQKTYADLALAYIFPYHFWYSRSYAHWLQRIVTQPGTVAAYAKYRKALEKIHAGAPEWYKYQVNTNELFGVNSDNPLFFNFEATLNPLNGLTGVDFTDPRKRKDFYTNTLDDLNKFGPSTWTPFSWAAAIHMKAKGEDDAAARWAGRLIPLTSTIKAGLSAMNINIDTLGGINELDPMVHIFSGGIDPYERDRVGRALGWMIESGEVDRETALEAARTQEGDVWREGLRRAIHARAGGQLSSFLFGVGFKARNVSDIEIDRFYTEYNRLWGMRDTLSKDEFRRMMDGMRDKYSFMDTVLLAKKAGPEKDTAYAYNVLSRVPPGQSDDVFRALGIDKLRTRFYDDKGDMAAWSESDRQSFMNAVIDLGALLKLPDTATRQEWTEASIANNKMYDDMEKQFGAAGIALYERWLALSEDIDAKRDLQNANPVLDQLLDYKDSMIVSNPLLRQYYASIEAVERYYGSFMSAKLEQQFGADIYDIQTAYYDLMTTKDQKAYKRQYPQLEQFWKAKAEYKKTVAEMVARTGKALKEGVPALLRTDETNSVGQERILDELNQPRVPEYYQYSYADWMQNFPPEMQRLLEDYVYGEKELPYVAEKELEYFAGRLNEEPEIILELIEQSAR